MHELTDAIAKLFGRLHIALELAKTNVAYEGKCSHLKGHWYEKGDKRY